jgi:hypothetical protein
MIHVAVALAIQLLLWPFGLWIGAAAAAAFFIGREIAQAEYRNIEHFYGGKRANMPWYGGFQKQAWTAKGLLDWILPMALTIAIAFAVE